MRSRIAFWVVVLTASALFAQTKASESSSASVSPYTPVHKFDPKRNASADIQNAIAEAQRTGKNIILDIGGDWCQYCHQMDQFFAEHADVLRQRDANFVTVDVYYGTDNKNQAALSRYTKILGVPHFFVLDKNGNLIHSQHVLDLRTGSNYDPKKMTEFFAKWAPGHEDSKKL